mmetsp:Transcript_20541/g.49732  ORF Transcript_20541/g.49732 Transcript_20541/m.49732 type:complete len:266 (+) Transcript_20541:2775-3572(+)
MDEAVILLGRALLHVVPVGKFGEDCSTLEVDRLVRDLGPEGHLSQELQHHDGVLRIFIQPEQFLLRALRHLLLLLLHHLLASGTEASPAVESRRRLDFLRPATHRSREGVSGRGEACERVGVRVGRHAEAPQQALHRLLRREPLSSEEEGMFDEVSDPLLLLLLIHTPRVYLEVHVEAALRLRVRHDAVPQPVRQNPRFEFRVLRQRLPAQATPGRVLGRVLGRVRRCGTDQAARRGRGAEREGAVARLWRPEAVQGGGERRRGR